MPDLTSHDGRTVINTAVNSITINGKTHMIEHEWGDYPVAATYTVPGYESIEARLMYEEDGSSCDPRKDRDNFGTFATFGHIARDYIIGDEQWDSDMRGDDFEITCPMCEGEGEDDSRWTIERYAPGAGYTVIAAGTFEAMNFEHDRMLERGEENLYIQRINCPKCKGNQTIDGTVLDYVRIVYDAVVAVPVYVDPGHGASNGWCKVDTSVDDSTNGIVFISRSDFIKEYGSMDDIDKAYTPEHMRMWHDDPPSSNREAAIRCLTSEVEEMDKYLRGECYWIKIIDELSGYDESCGGYLGDDWSKESLFWDLATAIEAHDKELVERADMAARDIETV